jgi:hypothetical protein
MGTKLSTEQKPQKRSLHPEFAKPLERHTSQIGWITMKVILKTALLNAHNNCEYTIRALCLDKMPSLSNALDCASIHSYIIDFYSKEALSRLNFSFFATLSNLNSDPTVLLSIIMKFQCFLSFP